MNPSVSTCWSKPAPLRRKFALNSARRPSPADISTPADQIFIGCARIAGNFETDGAAGHGLWPKAVVDAHRAGHLDRTKWVRECRIHTSGLTCVFKKLAIANDFCQALIDPFED